MAYVIKIKYEENLRRFTVPYNNGEILSFSDLEWRIRDLFHICASAELVVTYTDNDADTVTMANDHDLKDALVHQSLNPLRLQAALSNRQCVVSIVSQVKESEMKKSAVADESYREEVDVQLMHLFKKYSAEVLDMQSVKNLLQSCEPLFEKAKSPAQIKGLVENVVQIILSRSPLVTISAAAANRGQFTSNSCTQVPLTDQSETGAACQADRISRVPAGRLGRTESRCVDAVHHGVLCDVCGVSPIVGVRWKSNKKPDYDLCGTCFENNGNVDEYTKIDRPMFRPRHLHAHRGLRGCPAHPMGAPNLNRQVWPSGMHGGGRGSCSYMRGGAFGGRCNSMGSMRPVGGKLDARFVRDVTMFDGTELAPGTYFTKIWRLRNSGDVAWPVDTRLVHIGGDELGQVSMVPLEIPEQGLAPDAEMEVSVDLIAPQKPGRYVSHWRLTSPHGPKFGHRVWVLIQVIVDNNLDDAANEVEGEDSKRIVSTASAESVTQEVALSVSNMSADDHLLHQLLSVTASFPLAELVQEAVELGLTDEAVADSKTVEGREKSSEPHTDVQLGTQDAKEKAEIAATLPAEGSLELNNEPRQLEPTMSFEAVNPVGGDSVKLNSSQDDAASRDVYDPVVEDGYSMVDTCSGTADAVAAAREVIGLKVEAGENPWDPRTEAITFSEVDEDADDEDFTASAKENLAATEDTSPAGGEEETTIPESSLAKLEAMGFTDRKLNLDILEKNNFDLRKTLNDLCTAEEWDPILEELVEMGFYDTNMNRRLMFKNNGSVKRVVKDLVEMDKNNCAGKGKQRVL